VDVVKEDLADNRILECAAHAKSDYLVTGDTGLLGLGSFEDIPIVKLRSRNDNDFSLRYPAIAKALSSLPNETVVDGEVVALDLW
jgi:hypothetical protein